MYMYVYINIIYIYIYIYNAGNCNNLANNFYQYLRWVMSKPHKFAPFAGE